MCFFRVLSWCSETANGINNYHIFRNGVEFFMIFEALRENACICQSSINPADLQRSTRLELKKKISSDGVESF